MEQSQDRQDSFKSKHVWGNNHPCLALGNRPPQVVPHDNIVLCALLLAQIVCHAFFF